MSRIARGRKAGTFACMCEGLPSQRSEGAGAPVKRAEAPPYSVVLYIVREIERG